MERKYLDNVNANSLKKITHFKKRLLFCSAVLSFSSLFFAFAANAQSRACVPCYVCPSYWTCDNSCGGTLTAWQVDSCCNGPDLPCNTSTGEAWQKCDSGAGAHYCNSSCLPRPENLPKNPRWYDDPTKNDDPTASKGNTNNTLPIVLDWELNSWKDGGKYNADGSAKLMARENYGANSFYIEIDNPDNQLFEPEKVPNSKYDPKTKIFGKCLTNDFFNSRDDGLACFFRSGKKEINYRVKACCSANCTDCGPFVGWNFSTGDFAEPKSPLDPDWNGPEAGTGFAPKDLQLEWCRTWMAKSTPVDWAKSYRLMVTLDEERAGTQNCHPLLVSNGQCVDANITGDSSTGIVKTSYPVQGRNDFNFFTRNRTYGWKMKTCYDETSSRCAEYGQSWSFVTKNDQLGIPTATSPADDPQGENPAAMPVSLSWTTPDGANSFIYQTTFTAGDQKSDWSSVPNSKSSPELKAQFDADNLKPDTIYKWRVRACAKFDFKDCDGWSPWFSFRTTGRPPAASSMTQSAGVPATFSWPATGGAKSYNFSLSGSNATSTGEIKAVTLNDPATLQNTKYTLNYPDINQGQNYTWKIQACAHSDGTACGAWSEPVWFASGQMTPPQDLEPANGSTVVVDGASQDISWNAVLGALAYRYTLSLITPNEPNCVREPIENIVVPPNDSVQIDCLGEYQLVVQPCVDKECKSLGPQSESNFVLSQQASDKKSMLLVCGTNYDIPQTAWNERETCQPKHLLVLAAVIINFLLFRFSILLLPILAVITGLIFYSPLKTPEILEKVRSAWQAIGIGYGLLFMAWLLVGFILQAIGYPGVWWKIL